VPSAKAGQSITSRSCGGTGVTKFSLPDFIPGWLARLFAPKQKHLAAGGGRRAPHLAFEGGT